MDPVFKKLQLKDQDPVLVLAAPDAFAKRCEDQDGPRVLSRPGRAKQYGFGLAFARSAADIDKLARRLDQHLEKDGLLWIAYPKKSSKRYQSDISRDHGWQALGDLGYEGVRQIAIDEDWSALRFRKPEHIKKMARAAGHAMSAAGKRRADK